MVETAGGHERRDGNTLLVCPAIREDQERCTIVDGSRGLLTDAIQCTTHALRALRHRPSGINGVDTPAVVGHPFEGLHLLRRQDGLHKLKPPGLGRLGRSHVALRADHTTQRCDELFADGVDGRVGHLSKQLLEVVVEQAGAIGHTGQGRVVAHGTERVGARPRHGGQDHVHRLHCIPKRRQWFDQALNADRGVWVGAVVGYQSIPVGEVAISRAIGGGVCCCRGGGGGYGAVDGRDGEGGGVGGGDDVL
mmetsp:Transcript_8066/g.12985  ORF Transcript_8066/g.12985 Transcript_8066/m.12985 type:complete len:250 (-) Transcript_8066:1683-2432(-)